MGIDVNDIHLEILEEIKKLAVEQATLKATIEAHLVQCDKIEEDIKDLQKDTIKLNKHDFIIKGMLWVYGAIISTLLYKFIPGRFS